MDLGTALAISIGAIILVATVAGLFYRMGKVKAYKELGKDDQNSAPQSRSATPGGRSGTPVTPMGKIATPGTPSSQVDVEGGGTLIPQPATGVFKIFGFSKGNKVGQERTMTYRIREDMASGAAAANGDVDLSMGKLDVESQRRNAELTLKLAMENDKAEDIDKKVSAAVVHGCDVNSDLVFGARILVDRLTNGFLGFESAGAWHKKILSEDEEMKRRAKARTLEADELRALQKARGEVEETKKFLDIELSDQSKVTEALMSQEEKSRKLNKELKVRMERIDHAADLSRSSLGSALALAQTHDAARKEALQGAMESVWENLFGSNGASIAPMFHEAEAKLKAIQAEEAIAAALEERLAEGDALKEVGLGAVLSANRGVGGVSRELLAQADLALQLRDGIRSMDADKIAAAERAGAVGALPLHRAAAVTLERLSATGDIKRAVEARNLKMLEEALARGKGMLGPPSLPPTPASSEPSRGRIWV
eukprot:CAMPEP_0182887278 /NCGR_PEP_ID=MMETSP0034_2-20130328/20728_1 /TAXON_ID=156128 /ORGANISM="Nephroselmis pyriformis, Strain CCMP717" /LENGTH=481 /DNA_ID=CAMNT_0025020637 /DNA_START=102 /DNA_END=1547 /DNA_ORIENTATION=-